MIPAFEDLDARIVLYAIASLTVVRMVPVALALLGTRQGRPTVAFIGWFGPRGLASVVFAFLAVEELGGTDPSVLAAVNTITVTIVFSIVAHGITARPLATRYLAALEKAHRRAPDLPAPHTGGWIRHPADPPRLAGCLVQSGWRPPVEPVSVPMDIAE